MSTIAVIKAAKQEKLFKLSDSERAAKYVQVLGVPASALGPQMLAARDEERSR